MSFVGESSGVKEEQDEAIVNEGYTSEEQDDCGSDRGLSDASDDEVVEDEGEFDSNASVDVEDSDESELEVNTVEPITFGTVTEFDGEECFCKTLTEKRSAARLMQEMVDLSPNLNNHYCVIDNIIKCYNMLFKSDEDIDKYKICFTDLYYRIRHEYLFKILCMSLNLPVIKSDVKFSILGIDSERTPDLIHIDEETGAVIIVEFTVSSSLERSAQSKGMEQYGFESKYKRELDLLNDLGIQNCYYPVFINMGDVENELTKGQLRELRGNFKENEPYKILFLMACKEFSILTGNLKSSLVLSSSVLFSEKIKIKEDHSRMEFLYKKSKKPLRTDLYKEVTISAPVYNKLYNDRDRMFKLLDNSTYKSTDLCIFILNTREHQFRLIKDKRGAVINDLRQIMIDNNITELVKYVKLKTGNVVIDSDNSDVGVKFYERSNVRSNVYSSKKCEDIPLLKSHHSTDYSKEYDFSPYYLKLMDYKSDNYHSRHRDIGYEDVIINAILSSDRDSNDMSHIKAPNLLANNESVSIDIDAVFESIEKEYVLKNTSDDSLPVKKLKMKSPFIIPIADLNESSYCAIEFKNEILIESLIMSLKDDNPYTAVVLEGVLKENYKMYEKPHQPSKTLKELQASRHEVSNRINKLQKELKKLHGEDSISNTNVESFKSKFIEEKARYNNYNKEINRIRKSEGLDKNISLLRVPIKGKNSALRGMYEKEMSHFKNRKSQSTIEGVGIINNVRSDYKDDLSVFCNISDLLTENRGHNKYRLLDDMITPDAKLINELKVRSLDNYRSLLNEICDSCLGHATALISNLSHSLMFYSQLPFDSDNVRVDNLGYKNVLLMVRGGKKIFKSKSSKLFRLIYPISEVVLPWYVTGHQEKGSNRVLKIGNITYMITPWVMWHESILTDSISFHPRVCSFVLLNSNPSIDMRSQFSNLSLNVLLAFHNRRKTEVILANMRYILLSTLGDFTGIAQILPEFFDFNYDRFQSFVRSSILLNYPKYFKQLQELKLLKKGEDSDINNMDFVNSNLKSIFTNQIINKVESLALMIYSTFLMTKAPYQKLSERANNIKGILEIHDYYKKTVGLGISPEEHFNRLKVECNGDLNDYSEKLFNNDFNFDPKFCALVGNFIDSHLYQNVGSDDIASSWLRIMNKSWDEMATSTGLRGDYNDLENFWGQKGYFVVYKRILDDTSFRESLKQLLTQDIDDSERRKRLRSLNEVYLDKTDLDREFLIFHAVDKVQWRGSREIYVMDIHTKLIQQPIEKFMGYLCSKLDNELISIPSDRRAQVIHHAIFEKDLPQKDKITWFLTLDCSKWAPKSVFVKFAVMILNMSTLPNSFKTHFLNYIDKLYSKRVYFNEGEVKVLMNNSKHKSLCDEYLVKDEKQKAYYLEMPYSWVMGIFNYTSSFLHAANQKYISYLLMKTSLISFQQETSIMMFAHSDDSGGRLCVNDIHSAKRALVIYEVLLKSCNHLLSKKKSVVSRIYFEILSVIYLFKKLLALLPKFLGGIRFLPSDKGPAHDMSQAYSKCIEVMVAGSDFQVAYIYMKIYSYLVWRFYYNRPPTIEDYNRPVQFLGMPDSHPLFVLLCGSDSDILRLLYNKVNLTRILSFVNSFTKTMDSEGPFKPLKFEIKVKGIKRGFEDYIEEFSQDCESWPIRNVNFNNTGMNVLSFLRKLNDSGFVGSLVNESVVRRLSRSYYIRNNQSAITRLGNVRLNDMKESLNLCMSYSSGDGLVKHILEGVLGEQAILEIEEEFRDNHEKSEYAIKLLTETLRAPLKIYKYLDSLSMDNRRVVAVSRTLKPTQVQLVKSTKVFSTRFDPASLVSYIKFPEYNWALSNVNNLFTSRIELESFVKHIGYDIEKISPDLLLRICRTYGADSSKNIYLYSRVPSEVRQIRSFSSFLTFLSVNSFYGFEITGLTIKLSEKDMVREYLRTSLREEVYIVNDMITIMMIMIEKCELPFVLSLNLNPIEEINFEGGDVGKLITSMRNNVTQDIRFNFIRPQLEYLGTLIDNIPFNIQELKSGSFYTFIKSQKLRKGWYGEGEVYIYIAGVFYSMMLNNKSITKVYTNIQGKVPYHHTEFINEVCECIGVNLKDLKRVKFSSYNNTSFGFDSSGDLSIVPGRELSYGADCTILSKRNCFADNLESLRVIDYREDTLIVETGFEQYVKTEKLHLIPIRKGEIMPMIREVFKESDFSDKLSEMGLNDFEEFLLTELMTEIGKELYLNFDEFLDNYNSSKIYSILKTVRDKDISKIPRELDFSPLPASDGSLIRILIDYSTYTNDKVVKTPLRLDPLLMSLRAEFSDKAVSLMGDKMVDYYNQIYTDKEKVEITEHYNNVLESDDYNEVKNGMIKLMNYWGYGSFVNCLEGYTLKAEARNYLYFNTVNLEKSTGTYSDLYVFIMKEIKNLSLKWSPIFNSLEFPVEYLKKYSSAQTWVEDYIYSTIMCTYNYCFNPRYRSLPHVIFTNCLLAYLKDEDFLADLSMRIKSSYILSSLPFTWKNKYDIVALLNNLRMVWIKVNAQKYKLDYTSKLKDQKQVQPGVRSYRSFLSDFDLKLRSGLTYYNGFVPQKFFSYVLGMSEISLEDRNRFRVTGKFSKESSVNFRSFTFFKLKRPLTEDFLESEDAEEIVCESEMADLDEDTIVEYFQNQDEIYKEKRTKTILYKNGKVTTATINWLVQPHLSCQPSIEPYLRQVGENIVIVTDTIMPMFLKTFPNSGVNIVDLNRTLRCNEDERIRPLLIYYSFQKELNHPEFINKYIKGAKFEYNESTSNLLKDMVVRSSDCNIKEPWEQGIKFDGDIANDKENMVIEEEGQIKVVKVKDYKKDKTPVEEKTEAVELTEDEKSYNMINEKIDELAKKGLFDDKTLKSIKNKYVNKALKDRLPLSFILKSIINIGELHEIKSALLGNKLGLSSLDQKNIFQSPKFFQKGSFMSSTTSECIKDKKVRSEINSIHSELAGLVSSGSLNLSFGLQKVVKANYKMWLKIFKGSEYKSENKKFLLTLFLMICGGTNVNNDDKHDHIWQSFMNSSTVYLSDDGPESEDDDEGLLNLIFDLLPSSRLKYRTAG